MKPCIFLALATFCILATTGCFPKDNSSNNFFSIPWPSDTRTVGEKGIFSSGQATENRYSNIEPHVPLNFSFNELTSFVRGNVFYEQGQDQLPAQKYGVNTGVFFSFDQKISSLSLPSDPRDASQMLLVNINSESTRFHENLPHMVDFKTRETQYRAKNMLTIMPHFGFPMEQNSVYAAIVYKTVQDIDGNAVIPTRLFQEINQPWSKDMLINQAQHGLWQEHRALVSQYLSESGSGKSIDDVAAFTVFSTQDVAAPALALRDALHTLEDSDIIDMVTDMRVTEHCNQTYPGATVLEGTIKMPRWQRNARHPLGLGDFPFAFSGGHLVVDYDGAGKLRMPTESERVPVVIVAPCLVAPTSYVVSQGGSTSSALVAADDVWRHVASVGSSISMANFDILTIAVGDYMSGPDRLDYHTEIDGIALLFGDMLDLFGVGVDSFSAILRTNFINPVAARNNNLQSAAEAYIIKRVAENLEHIALAHIGETVMTDAGFSVDKLRVERHQRVGYSGFSMGAVNGVLSMMMDEDFEYAYFGNGSGLTLPTLVDGDTFAFALSLLFGNQIEDGTIVSMLEDGELDYFHPIVSFMQTLWEGQDGINFVQHINLKNLLMTGGSEDTRAVAHSTQAYATALARQGFLASTGADGFKLLTVPGIEYIAGIPATPYPAEGGFLSANLAHGGTGVFTFFKGGHWGWPDCGMPGEFLLSASRGGAAQVRVETENWLSSPYCMFSDLNPEPMLIDYAIPQSITVFAEGVSGELTLGLFDEISQIDTLTIDGRGDFSFNVTMPIGAYYDIALFSEPIGQYCLHSNAAGYVGGGGSQMTLLCKDYP